MAKMPEELKDFLTTHLAYVATADEKGRPNVVPKGDMAILDDETLAFADLYAHQTKKNLMKNPYIAIMAVNPAAYSGYQLKGKAKIIERGKAFDKLITKEIAQNILTSLVVETGSFRLPNSRAFTFEVCADLIDKGATLYRLAEMVYWIRTREAALLSGIAVGRCKFIQDGKIAWSLLKESDFEKIKAEQESADSITDELRAIKEVRIAVLFKEKTGKLLRVSLRSKGAVNVGHLAQSYGGGGHYDAAGCCIPNSNNSMKKFLNAVKTLV